MRSQQPGQKTDQPGQAQQPGPSRQPSGQVQRQQPGDQQPSAQQPGMKGQSGREAAGSPGSGGRSVSLSAEQRTKIHGIIGKQKATHTTNVKFTISVGAKVPRTVRLYPLPIEVVEIVPAYRGYLYIVVEDEILIIDPVTFEIVAVLPA
jgi:hypothetical protein